MKSLRAYLYNQQYNQIILFDLKSIFVRKNYLLIICVMNEFFFEKLLCKIFVIVIVLESATYRMAFQIFNTVFRNVFDMSLNLS